MNRDSASSATKAWGMASYSVAAKKSRTPLPSVTRDSWSEGRASVGATLGKTGDSRKSNLTARPAGGPSAEVLPFFEDLTIDRGRSRPLSGCKNSPNLDFLQHQFLLTRRWLARNHALATGGFINVRHRSGSIAPRGSVGPGARPVGPAASASRTRRAARLGRSAWARRTRPRAAQHHRPDDR